MSDEPAVRRSTVRAVAVLGAMLAAAVGLALTRWLSLDLGGAGGWLVLAAVLVLVIVRIAIDGSSRPAVWAVTIGTALVTVAAVVVAIAVPLQLRQLEYGGTGVIWTADFPEALTEPSLRPHAVAGDTAVLVGEGRVVFLALADGRLLGEARTDEDKRPVVAGDRVLVERDGTFQLFEAGRAVWPDPIQADEVLAASEDVVVLMDCDERPGADTDDRCALTGHDLRGSTAWQRRIPGFGRGSQFLPDRTAPLPERVAFLSRNTAPLHWTVLDAADGRPQGNLRGDEIHLVGSTAFTIVADETGLCVIEADGTERYDNLSCQDPHEASLRDRLIFFDHAGPNTTVLRLEKSTAGNASDEEHDLVDGPTTSGDRPEADVGSDGWATLINQTLTFRHWSTSPSYRSEHESTPLSINLREDSGTLHEDTVQPLVTVDAGTAVVVATAERRHGDAWPDKQVIVFDFATGSETGRIRLPGNASTFPLVYGRESILGTANGQALICWPGSAPMLIGMPN